jgi:hypothetical protein
MSIRSRLEDATVLFSTGRREGAFLQVLIAAAATSRKRYKQDEWDDAESFKNFIYDELGVITNGMKYNVAFPFQGRTTPLEDIFYHHLRCQLVHEGVMPESISFTEHREEAGKQFSVLKLDDPFGFPIGWVETLATAIWLAPENDELWQDDEARRTQSRKSFGDKWQLHRFCRRPNQQSKEMKRRRERVEWEHNGKLFALTFPHGTKTFEVIAAIEARAKAQPTDLS